VRLLLDSPIALWWAEDETRLAIGARAAIAAPENELFLSVGSLWELAIKRGLGRLRYDVALLRRGLGERGVVELSITGEHALGIEALPPIHRDPFDRLLISQAMVENLTLVTADRVFEDYGIALLCGA
jgi:PIN domain nuclease of toxin-antitoxin system